MNNYVTKNVQQNAIMLKKVLHVRENNEKLILYSMIISITYYSLL